MDPSITEYTKVFTCALGVAADVSFWAEWACFRVRIVLETFGLGLELDDELDEDSDDELDELSQI